MIQYRLSINEQNALQAVESAVNLGAKWLQLDIADDITENTINAISGLCKEKEIIMVVENSIDRLKQSHCHGIHILPGTIHPKLVRDELGAEPIVGVTVKTPQEVIALRRADVDYVQIEPVQDNIEYYRDFAKTVHEANVDIHLVAGIEELNNELINQILDSGIDGLVYTIK